MMRSVWAIACLEVKESLRSRIIYVIGALTVLFILLGRGCNAGNTTVNATVLSDEVRQNLSVAMAFHMISFWSVVLCALIASGILPKEFEEKKMIMVLCRPVKRSSFLTGKLLAVMLISSISFVLFLILFFSFFYINSGQVNLSIFPGALLLLINLFSVAVISFFSSLFLPRMLAPLTGLLIYIISIIVEIPFYFDKVKMFWTPSAALQTFHQLFPRLGAVQLLCGSFVTASPSLDACLTAMGNVMLYSLAIWFAVIYLFEKRQL
jgi:ABC-type transport system involved in multi-copper enzyme maturation permease subunit